jgi:hypothetical protein
MELLGDVGHVESYFCSFEDSVNAGVRLVHGFHQKYHRLRKSLWMHSMVLQGDKAQIEPRFGPFGDSANLDAR